MSIKKRFVPSLVLFLGLITVLTFRPAPAAGFVDGLKDKAGEYKDTYEDAKDIVDVGKDVWDEANGLFDKFNDAIDPKMNSYYLEMKKREIQRALDDYNEAKKLYENTGWYRPFAIRSRKKKMDEARDKYFDQVDALSKAKVNFAYDVWKNTGKFTFWREDDRKKAYRKALSEHCNFLLDCADEKVKRTRREYHDEWCIFFWAKFSKWRAYEDAREDYEDARDEVTYLQGREGLLADDDWAAEKATRHLQQAQPAGEVKSIGIDRPGDM